MEAGVNASAAPMTSSVPMSAKMNASGTHFSVQAVSASAARAIKPASSTEPDGGRSVDSIDVMVGSDLRDRRHRWFGGTL
jgi:hypothetical protein